MRIRFGIVLSLIFLLTACAVVEPLSGGAEDIHAPKPNIENMSPENGSTNFTGNQLTIPFDEFFRLNNPSENIVVIPPDFKPKAKIKNKTLVLSWEESLKPNTTYAIYLNELVQDLSENNDSLMSFVFSTGAFIDSLTASFEVRDAFSKEVIVDQTVGLYDSFNDSVLPNYFGKTDKNGHVTLRYLKPGAYQLIAFDDLNKNLKPDKTESFGYRQTPFELTESISDSGAILISPTAQKPKITGFKLNPPSSFYLGANRSLKDARFELNGQPLSDEHVLFIEEDSVLIPFQWSDSSVYELVVKANNWADTTSFRLTQKDRNSNLTLMQDSKDDLFPANQLRFYSNHFISDLDMALISILNAKDSSVIPIRRINHLGALVEMDFDRKEEINDVIVQFLPLSVQSAKGSNTDTISFKIKVLTLRDVGTLIVKLEDYSTATIIELLKNGKAIQHIALSKKTNSCTFKNVMPGDYTFRVIVDANENERWDGGEYATQTSPEEVNVFLKPTRVRGNWETEVILKKNGL
jgi:uncharacterized protein (DUF2141 family)